MALGSWGSDLAVMFHVECFKDNVRCEEFFLNVYMMGSRTVFSPVVGVVGFTRAPVELEVELDLLLTLVITQPMKPYVHGLCAFRLDFSVDDCICHGIICLGGSRGLFVAHLVEDDSNVDSFMGHDVKGSQYGFSG